MKEKQEKENLYFLLEDCGEEIGAKDQLQPVISQLKDNYFVIEVAESEGFEPPCPFGRRFSRPVQ